MRNKRSCPLRVIAIVLPLGKRAVYDVQKSWVPVLEHGKQLIKIQFVLFLFFKLSFHVFHCFGLPIHIKKIKTFDKLHPNKNPRALYEILEWH